MEVRHDESGKDISGGSYMVVSAGAAGGSHDLVLMVNNSSIDGFMSSL